MGCGFTDFAEIALGLVCPNACNSCVLQWVRNRSLFFEGRFCPRSIGKHLILKKSLLILKNLQPNRC